MTQIPTTAADAARALRSGELTSVALTEATIGLADSVGDRLGTYVTRLDDSALQAAARADADFAAGIDRGPMQGIPIGVKDILAVAEGPTTANSLILDPAWGAGREGPVVRRLKTAGAVITGKTTTSEFACGGPDPLKPFAIPRDAWNQAHSAAGSSAGTGNGIAAGLFLAGIGTDTGGSVRAPSSVNGITGLKPTFGRVPKSGCVPLSWSLDHIGPMARSAEDCADLLAVIAGYDASDESCADRAVDDYRAALARPLDGVRIGVLADEHLPADIDPQVADSFVAAATQLADLGATLTPISLPYYDEMRAALVATMLTEAMSWHRQDLRDRWADYGSATRVTIGFGALIGSSDYVQAQRVRRVVKHKVDELFASVDLVISPTSPSAAPILDDIPVPLLGRLLTSGFTSYWNLTGQPALALPMGFSSDGLPLSLQITGRAFDEALVLQAGHAYQLATDWHLRAPSFAAQAAA